MLGRGFFLGVDVGCVLGVYVAPYLSRPTVGMGNIAGSILPQMNEATAVPERVRGRQTIKPRPTYSQCPNGT